MKFCNATGCNNPVFGKGFCRSHQHLREDFDSRSIVQRGIDKRKKEQQNSRLKTSIRSLHSTDEVKEMMSSRNSLILDLDRYCSLYVRIRDAVAYTEYLITQYDKEEDKVSEEDFRKISDGFVKCYTCLDTKHYTLMQAGHFISRSHIGLRFNVKDNLRTQCVNCNCIINGNLEVFAANLEIEQKGLVEMLQEQSRTVEKIGTDELKQLLVDIRSKYNVIKQKLINQPK